MDFEWEFRSPTGQPEEVIESLMPLNPDQVKSKSLHFDRTAELNLLGHRWYFGETLKGDGAFGSRALMYHLILEAFKNGSIDRFRACPHCKAFFVADDARQQFCSDEHRNDFNNKQRLEAGYFNKRRRRIRLALSRARILAQEGVTRRNRKSNKTFLAGSEARGSNTLEPMPPSRRATAGLVPQT